MKIPFFEDLDKWHYLKTYRKRMSQVDFGTTFFSEFEFNRRSLGGLT